MEGLKLSRVLRDNSAPSLRDVVEGLSVLLIFASIGTF